MTDYGEALEIVERQRARRVRAALKTARRADAPSIDDFGDMLELSAARLTAYRFSRRNGFLFTGWIIRRNDRDLTQPIAHKAAAKARMRELAAEAS